MKKNRMMRLASILLVCVLLSTSVISGTFAKYVTSARSTDSARVAKWGFEDSESIAINDLFMNAYDSTVKSSVDVIAPGTQNEVTFGFSYDRASNGVSAPEVDYTFEVDVEASGVTTNLDQNPNFVWTLDKNEYQKFGDLVAAIEALDGNQTKDGIENKYEAGTLPSAFYTGNNGDAKHTIGWKWLFEKDANSSGNFVDEDAFDTAMGNADVLENVNITISITATQLD